MDVSIAEAETRLAQLIRAFEAGEPVIITRDGKPVVQLASPPSKGRQVRWNTMQGRIHLEPGWDRALGEDEFLKGDV